MLAPHRGRISNFCGLPTAGGSGSVSTDSATCGGIRRQVLRLSADLGIPGLRGHIGESSNVLLDRVRHPQPAVLPAAFSKHESSFREGGQVQQAG